MRFRLTVFALALSLALAAGTGSIGAKSLLKGRFEPVIAETDEDLYDIRFFGRSAVMCGTDGMFVRSADAGGTWEPVQVQEGAALKDLHFRDERNGVVIGSLGIKDVLFRTRNGGDSFDQTTLDVPFPVRGVVFLDSQNGWLVAGSTRERDGEWRKTEDGGRTWQRPDSIAYGIVARVLTGITAVGEETIYVVGGHVEVALVGDAARSLLYRKKRGGVLKSEDGGRSWEVQDAGNPGGTRLWAVDFVDTEHGWVVGDAGFAARTSDGGRTWQSFDTGVDARLRAVDAVNAETAYAVGDDGAAVGTLDGGESFGALSTPTTRDLRGVCFTGRTTGFAVGKSGTLLRFIREW